ncbi:MAG: YcjF family protein [Candidatus Tectomicrobia bacterium]|nr:YcjF family protein [Candidatus Tectomicrobia bacterium]
MAETNSQTERANKIVKQHMLATLGVGLVPVPLVDLALLVGIQLNMLHRLAKLYEVEFSSHFATSMITSLLGGGISISLSSTVARLVASIPLYGRIIGMASTSVFSGASTYAIGKVFIQHFESGRTFLTFDPQQVREYYAEQLAQGKNEVRQGFVGVKP